METGRLKIGVSGLDCPSCAATVERAVQKIDGVLSVKLSFAAGTLEVEYRPERTGVEEIRKAVESQGYQLNLVDAAASQVIFRIEGMDCSDELRVIEASLRKSGGTTGTTANYVARTLTVTFDPAATTADKLRLAILDAGFPATEEGRPAAPALERSFGLARHIKLIMVIVSGLSLTAGILLSAGDYFGWWTQPVLLQVAEWQTIVPATIFYAIAIISGGYWIARNAIRAVRLGTFDMNLLMTMAAIGAAIIGEWAEGASAMFLFSLALLLESYTMGRARHAVEKLMDLAPRRARVRRNGGIDEVPVAEVQVGEVVIVRAGDTVPVDGQVLDGRTDVNQAPVTGESQLVAKSPGDGVFAGSINQHGVIEVQSSKPAEETTLARILHLVQEAQASRAPSQQFVERFSKYYTPSVIVGAALVAIIPPLLFGQSWADWILRALVLLVIACPCALVISTPVSIVAALAGAARRGILIKGGVHLENLGRARTFMLDKTGTLTYGRPDVVKVISLDGTAQDEVLRVAAAVEAHSEHLLAEAIRQHATQERIDYEEGRDSRALPGRGAEARIGGRLCHVGNLRLVEEFGSGDGADFVERFEREETGGHTAVAVLVEGRPVGIIVLIDQPRQEALDSIRSLQAMGMKDMVMLTGDNEQTARSIAGQVGLSHVHAALLPDEKLERVRHLTQRDQWTVMVGDGVNDAPALAAATVGIAMGAAGSDVAIETADVALMTDHLDRLPEAVGLGRRTLKIIRQNITIALGMKAVFMALAVANMATLWMAVLADMGASLIVIGNGLRLLGRRPR